MKNIGCKDLFTLREFECFIANSLHNIGKKISVLLNRGCICISSVRRTYGRIHMLPAYIQSSSKYNNSVNRIISKEGEREDPRRELQSIFEYSGISTFLFEYNVFYSVSTRSPTVNSIYRINSTRNTTTTRLIPCRLIQGIFQ